MTQSDEAPPTTICLSADDAEYMANLLNPVTAHVVTLQTIDCEQPLDAYLDAVAAQDSELVLECRHIDERCIPRGPTWTVPLNDVIYLHIW